MNEEQFQTKYKKAVDTMTTNEEMKTRMENRLQELQQEQKQKRPRKMVYIAASIVLAAGIGVTASSFWKQGNAPTSPGNEVAKVNPNTPAASSPASVVIPKVELPDTNSGVQADMIPLVVYQGSIYTQAATRIDAADATKLRGDKLGRTTAGIDEMSGQDEYTELAANIGEADIYAVKGYDSKFRIMSYTETDGQVYAELFEHTNGITVNSGADLLGKLNLEGRIASAEWESFESWNNGQQQHTPLANDESLASFLTALQDAKPLAAEPLIDQGIYDDENRKILYLKLEDHTRVELTLFGQGLVRYGDAPVFFEVESGAFQAFWKSMSL
ncbi:hypothetical protein OIN60_03190 [Paenibacillus sp. P96]|uniref:DUF3298 domain-containing protein n=1 Tax=Paenibacillus zeirhizosphaerae TaxID=2987519 RepID=A0ABT9FM30_9BACL|nr:hypothetical protein [Paenibacillus sp. P96]MDP4095794.1 hypothetical protein [Paenibacillus sp. P96]